MERQNGAEAGEGGGGYKRTGGSAGVVGVEKTAGATHERARAGRQGGEGDGEGGARAAPSRKVVLHVRLGRRLLQRRELEKVGGAVHLGVKLARV